MCLVILAHRAHSQLPLVVAGNRDEFHARPTAPAGFWGQHRQLLAGRDLEQGGTWMGITRNGRFATITNYRDPARTAPAPRSRGELPLNFLTGNDNPLHYLQTVAASAGEYAGFNLLLGDRAQMCYFTNSLPATEHAPVELPPGIYGLSNARLDTPWPKVLAGREQMTAVLESGKLDHDALARVVQDRQLADPAALHRQGLVGEMDQVLSAQFIVTSLYGTRATTTLWLDDGGEMHWREQSFDAQGELSGTQSETFTLSPPSATAG